MNWVREIVKMVRRLVHKELADVHTHLPAQVIAYNAATNTCSVRACINRIRSEDPLNLTTVESAVLEDVPVHHFGSGLVHCTCPPTALSYGSLHISERSIEKWMTAGGVANPTSARKFDISDAIFLPGLYPIPALFPVPINTDRIEFRTLLGTSYISLVNDGSIELTALGLGLVTMAIDGTITVENAAGSWELSAAGVTTINASSDAVALKSKVDTHLAAIHSVISGWTPVSNDGGAALKTAWMTAFPDGFSSTTSTKLKVDA